MDSLQTEDMNYEHNNEIMQGKIAFDKNTGDRKLPGVIMIHDAFGIKESVLKRMRDLASVGYIAFAADMFAGKKPSDINEAMPLLKPMMENRKLMQDRAHAALKVLQGHPKCDPTKVVFMGYCFGGGVSLEMARMGYEGIVGVASFHGTLAPGEGYQPHPIKAKVIVFHGAEDQRINLQVAAFHDEMRASNADWVFVTFGNAVHGFTNTDFIGRRSPVGPSVAYNEKADHRSWRMFLDFLVECFA